MPLSVPTTIPDFVQYFLKLETFVHSNSLAHFKIVHILLSQLLSLASGDSLNATSRLGIILAPRLFTLNFLLLALLILVIYKI